MITAISGIPELYSIRYLTLCTQQP